MLDVQIEISSTSLEMVVVYSDGHVKVYELLDCLKLKNCQLQAEFQNVIESISTCKSERVIFSLFSLLSA